ncbi:uncharacterized protein LOC130990569 [Salvia miltiorrhiza]|uniref:uncharacterized protein LOC130990569 n=1 Tax=Salvia miltiorrhiza TaxID=226208 RepID=UPI0025AC2DCF|nr:uncharacterized protein LOC130990569 [Salvia miltiorrhiza]
MENGWWSKIVAAAGRGNEGWFLENIKRRLGDGRGTKFWEDSWVGRESLNISFHRLYRLCENRKVSVGESGRWVEGVWVWDLKWRRELRDCERETVKSLMDAISSFVPTAGTKDRWTWRAATDGRYSTKSTYDTIKSKRSVNQNQRSEVKTLVSVWKTAAPQKALVTAWRLLRNRLPTADNLRKRNIMLGDVNQDCPWCHAHGENLNHLFLTCSKAQELWDEIQSWTGISSARPSSAAAHWIVFSECGKEKKVRNLLKTIWVGCIWLMWRKRNEKIFEGKDWEVKTLVREIKIRSWCWNKIFGILDPDMDLSRWCCDDLISHFL